MATAAQYKQNLRRGLMAKIHIAKKQLALHDDTYRDLLHNVTGKESCADLNVNELERVLDRFKSLGFKSRKPKRAGKVALAQTQHSSKIRALWLNLYHLGEVRDPSEEALNAYVKRIASVNSLQWLRADKADQVIRTLYKWLERAGLPKPPADIAGQIVNCRAVHRVETTMSADGLAFKLKLIEILSQRLKDHETDHNLLEWIMLEGLGKYEHIALIDQSNLDAIIERLSARVREVSS